MVKTIIYMLKSKKVKFDLYSTMSIEDKKIKFHETQIKLKQSSIIYHEALTKQWEKYKYYLDRKKKLFPIKYIKAIHNIEVKLK